LEKSGISKTTWTKIRNRTHWNFAYWIYTGETTIEEIRARFHWRRPFPKRMSFAEREYHWR